jgi:nitrite reductase/ring-hydroxylating ferredoxin subunit
MSKERVGLVRDIPPGTSTVVTARGREIVVFNVGGEFYALLNRCPHEGAKLSRGLIVGLPESDAPGCYKLTRPGEILRCPWHGWEFDLRTGKSHCDPTRLFSKQYETVVEPEAVQPEDQLTAETFSVSVEEATVFVEL